jgi:DMSO/TMAO reductase YedYZ heme-binding membrane subunit
MKNKPIIIALAILAAIDLVVFIYLLISSFSNPDVSKDVIHSAFFTGTILLALVAAILACRRKKDQ